MEPLWTTLTSPSVNFGATLSLWIILSVMTGTVIVLWRHHCHCTDDKIHVAYARGYSKGIDIGYVSGKQAGLDTAIYHDWVDAGLTEMSKFLESQP